jgi:hypothetical protein
MNVLIVIDQLLPPLDFLLQHFHLPQLVPLDLPNHRIEITVRTVFKQDRVHLPKSFTQVHVPTANLAQERVEAHRIDEERLVDALQVARVDPLGKQRVFIDAVLLKGGMLDGRVEFLLVAVLEQDLVEPVLQVLVLETALRELLLVLRKTAALEGERGRRSGRGLVRDLEVDDRAVLGLLEEQRLLHHAVVLRSRRLREPWKLLLASTRPLPDCSSSGQSAGRQDISWLLRAIGELDSSVVG